MSNNFVEFQILLHMFRILLSMNTFSDYYAN